MSFNTSFTLLNSPKSLPQSSSIPVTSKVSRSESKFDANYSVPR